MGVPISLVHVVRNPWDNIATMFRRSRDADLRHTIDRYFSLVEAVAAVMREASVDTVHLEELVASPQKVLGKLVESLGVQPSAGYLTACAELVWGSPKKTRAEAPWNDQTVALVAERAMPHLHLRGYQFNE